MKIGILASDIPSTTFIERLITGLGLNGVSVLVFGKVNKRTPQRRNVKIIGFKSYYPARVHKILFFVRYFVLLSLFKRKEKRRLDSILYETKRNSLDDLITNYPILWHQPDVLHIQWAKAIGHFLWVRDFNIKLVVSLRGAHINYSPITVPGLAESYQKVFPQIDGFHGVSRAICIEAAKYGAAIEKCHVVYSGFDLTQFSKEDWIDKSNRSTHEPIQIISVGRSHWKKGYHFALDAMALLNERGIPFTYTVVGAAGNEELMFQRHQLGLEEKVVFLDKVPFERVKQYIREADVLLLPSVEEGIANVVLEAMLLGTLVVTTDCGGMTESVVNGKTGFVVPVRNTTAMADAIQGIAETDAKDRKEMLDLAYEETAKQHNEAKMVHDMLALYTSLLKKHE